MTSIQTQAGITLEEFLQLPETKLAREYIDGQIYQKPVPQGKHSRLQTRLSAVINQQLEPQRLGCAFTELRCTFAGRSIVPDIAVFSWARIPLDQNGDVQNVFPIPPDWSIEILSPDQSPTCVINNFLFCLNHGTRLGTLIDPEDRSVITFQPGQQPIAQEDPTDILLVPDLMKHWQFTVGKLFGWLNFPG
jgi:Uma2 family endonuclease